MSTLGAMSQPHILRNPGQMAPHSEQQIADGIIRGALNQFQLKAEGSLIKTGKEKRSSRPDLSKAGGKENKTKVRSGMVPFPGAVSHPYS